MFVSEEDRVRRLGELSSFGTRSPRSNIDGLLSREPGLPVSPTKIRLLIFGVFALLLALCFRSAGAVFAEYRCTGI